MSRSPVSTLNPYTAVSSNKRKTALLVVAFILVIGVAALAIGIILGLPLEVSAIVAGIATVISLLISYWAYRSGDSLVLGIAEAKPANRQEHLELFRTVENLSIGSGLPMPKVYVIQDDAPNAFATGRDPEHASVAVTTGLLSKLNKIELEGVIAHELSHIGNFDIRLMMMTAVLVGLIAILADIALRATWFGAGRRSRYRGKGEGGGAVILLVVAIVAVVLAPILAKVIQMAVSRQREYLADASGALLTRYPEGLASALEKIAGDPDPLDEATKGTAHMYIVNPLAAHNKSGLNGLFSSHPPIEDRVARLRAMMGVAEERA